MSYVITSDSTQIFYTDWGSGRPVIFSHGWPLNADSWEAQMLFLASSGYRCIAHDRRGHGRSSRPWNGNEMDTRGDLAKFDVTTLVIHGDDDQIVPFEIGGKASAALIGGATLKIYPGAPHGITDTHKEQLNADLLSFVRQAAPVAVG